MNFPICFYASTDIVLLGQDAEMADYDNPRGYIYGYSAYVVAEYENGRRFTKHIKTGRYENEVFEMAERQAAALNVRMTKLKKLPVAFNTWYETYPVYGSDVYDEQETIRWEQQIEEDTF